jgi:hypothetical protein
MSEKVMVAIHKADRPIVLAVARSPERLNKAIVAYVREKYDLPPELDTNEKILNWVKEAAEDDAPVIYVCPAAVLD